MNFLAQSYNSVKTSNTASQPEEHTVMNFLAQSYNLPFKTFTQTDVQRRFPTAPKFIPIKREKPPEKMLKPLPCKAPTASTKESARERFLGAVGFIGLIFTAVYFTVIQNPKQGFSPNSTTVLAFRIRFEVNTTKSPLQRTYRREEGSTHATSGQHRDSEVLSITGKGATSQIDTSERRKVTAFVS